MRVIFIFVLLFFGFTFRIGSEKSDLFAIGRPRKTMHAALAFGYGCSFSVVGSNYVNLLLIVAIRKKRDLFPVGRPSRGSFILRRKCELPDHPRLLVIEPDMTRTPFAFGRLR